MQIRVVVGTEDPEIANIDNGALVEWLQRQEEDAQQGSSSAVALQPRIVVIGHNFKPIPANLEDAELCGLTRSLSTVRASATRSIATPSYTNIQATSSQGDCQCQCAYCALLVILEFCFPSKLNKTGCAIPYVYQMLNVPGMTMSAICSQTFCRPC